MCSSRISDACSPETPHKRSGSRIWYVIKAVEYVFIAVCLLLLILSEHLSTVHDDFTPAYHHYPNDTTDKNNLSAYYPVTLEFYYGSSDLLGDQRNDSDNTPEIKLSHLLVLYPSCTTVIIFLTMELVAQVFKDFLNKISNLIITAVCLLLSVVIFIESLICAISSVHISLILISVLSAALVILLIIDFALMIMSQPTQ